MTLLSITETPNSLTENIDLADASGMLALFSRTDEQIFKGWEDWNGMSDDDFVNAFIRAHSLMVQEISSAISSGKRLKIVFTGAGTSGRLAMLLATTFNAHYRPLTGYDLFDFIIAGGALALIKAQEGAEDDALEGIADLTEKTKDCHRFITVGITCGFSANYISGQMYYSIIERGMPAFLIGFNPVDRARTIHPENWPYSFSTILEKIKNSENLVLLNPVVGPEPVTGSTRLKGGTATKMIGDMLLTLVLYSLRPDVRDQLKGISFSAGEENIGHVYRALLQRYHEVKNTVYHQIKGLEKILTSAGESLKAHGHLYYVGEGIAGRLGIIDASECPPTYGADFHDVRGFTQGGWSVFCPSCEDQSTQGDLYHTSIEYFENDLLPGLSSQDMVIFTGSNEFLTHLDRLIRACAQAATVRICLDWQGGCDAVKSELVIPSLGDCPELPLLTSVAVKLIYNAITTAAHIFKGKVYKNKMIDLRISNNKLYYRSLNILRELTGIDERAAETALLRSIYQTDHVDETIRSLPVSRHIMQTKDREKIIPLALVLAASTMTVNAAKERVEQDGVVRNIIHSFSA